MCMFNSVNNGCDVCAADLRARVSFLCIFFQVDFFCMSLLRWGFDVINQDSDACPLKRHLICRLQLRTGCIKSRKAASPKFWRTMKVQFSGRDSGTGNDTTCAFGILSTRLQRKKKTKNNNNWELWSYWSTPRNRSPTVGKVQSAAVNDQSTSFSAFIWSIFFKKKNQNLTYAQVI